MGVDDSVDALVDRLRRLGLEPADIAVKAGADVVVMDAALVLQRVFVEGEDLDVVVDA